MIITSRPCAADAVAAAAAVLLLGAAAAGADPLTTEENSSSSTGGTLPAGQVGLFRRFQFLTDDFTCDFAPLHLSPIQQSIKSADTLIHSTSLRCCRRLRPCSAPRSTMTLPYCRPAASKTFPDR